MRSEPAPITVWLNLVRPNAIGGGGCLFSKPAPPQLCLPKPGPGQCNGVGGIIKKDSPRWQQYCDFLLIWRYLLYKIWEPSPMKIVRCCTCYCLSMPSISLPVSSRSPYGSYFRENALPPPHHHSHHANEHNFIKTVAFPPGCGLTSVVVNVRLCFIFALRALDVQHPGAAPFLYLKL